MSRDSLLDVAERLMSAKGYAATPVSAICREAGVAATSLYWHFGSKEGLRAAVLDRGAERWFAALPRWADLDGDKAETVVRAGAAAVGGHPEFLRMFYALALQDTEDPAAAELVGRVRARATAYFRDLVAGFLPDVDAGTADALTRFAVAYSDGCFFAARLDPDADLNRMYADLLTALRALAEGSP